MTSPDGHWVESIKMPKQGFAPQKAGRKKWLMKQDRMELAATRGLYILKEHPYTFFWVKPYDAYLFRMIVYTLNEWYYHKPKNKRSWPNITEVRRLVTAYHHMICVRLYEGESAEELSRKRYCFLFNNTVDGVVPKKVGSYGVRMCLIRLWLAGYAMGRNVSWSHGGVAECYMLTRKGFKFAKKWCNFEV